LLPDGGASWAAKRGAANTSVMTNDNAWLSFIASPFDTENVPR